MSIKVKIKNYLTKQAAKEAPIGLLIGTAAGMGGGLGTIAGVGTHEIGSLPASAIAGALGGAGLGVTSGWGGARITDKVLKSSPRAKHLSRLAMLAGLPAGALAGGYTAGTLAEKLTEESEDDTNNFIAELKKKIKR